MSTLLQIAIVAAALWIGSWLIMILLAKRLPPGLLRDTAEFLPACVTTARRLRGNPAVPRRAKVALLIAIVWVLSPIDLLPSFSRSSDRSTMSSPSFCCCATPHEQSHAMSCSPPGRPSHGCSNDCYPPSADNRGLVKTDGRSWTFRGCCFCSWPGCA